jgi:hypothetical protein
MSMATANRKRLPTYFPADPNEFPNLTDRNNRVRSPKRDAQNCIAFAAGDDIHFWWPIPGTSFPGKYKPPYHWPDKCPEEETLAAFESAFATVGFERCDDGRREKGYVKIAIFGHGAFGDPNAKVRHAARQSPFRNGQWRSKMGMNYDIDHDISAIEGPLYGAIVGFMRKVDQ